MSNLPENHLIRKKPDAAHACLAFFMASPQLQRSMQWPQADATSYQYAYSTVCNAVSVIQGSGKE